MEAGKPHFLKASKSNQGTPVKRGQDDGQKEKAMK